MSNSTIKISFTYNENSLSCDHGIYPLFPVGWSSINIDNTSILEEFFTGPMEFYHEMRILLSRKFNELVNKKIIKSFIINKI
jgi:hypothetical protein